MCTLGLSNGSKVAKGESTSALQVVTDFFDEMKSRSKGYASMEYQITGYRPNKLVRLDVKINQEVRSNLRTSLGYPVPGNLLCFLSLLSNQWMLIFIPASAGGRALGVHCTQGCCVQSWPSSCYKAERAHTQAAVQDTHPSSHWQQGHCL